MAHLVQLQASLTELVSHHAALTEAVTAAPRIAPERALELLLTQVPLDLRNALDALGAFLGETAHAPADPIPVNS